MFTNEKRLFSLRLPPNNEGNENCLPKCCCCLVAKSCLTLLWPHGQQPTRLLCPWDFPVKNTGEGCHFLLQGIFLTQRSNPLLLHWQVNSLQLSHQGSPVHPNSFLWIWFSISYLPLYFCVTSDFFEYIQRNRYDNGKNPLRAPTVSGGWVNLDPKSHSKQVGALEPDSEENLSLCLQL